ncbi:RraA family protein [Acidaminococcus fermentans]|jgi:4-hydroxy-4-methyl-2-oxoglutarate aldolase|uniref:RraA family protein n=1 Tax=Acidaminococcus fermentans TaxID=905 RepID=UPI0015A2F997|nr:RraA family protein [Acidaminococcus fermentans]MEE1597437.1 RraA family protein [Acidaminococcus fermentans]MEE4121701.1 RraA family protein [Acidaminococcus fermentans]
MTQKNWIGKIGFRYRAEIQRPQSSVCSEVKKFSTCNLADGAARFYVMDHGIHAVSNGEKITGPAVTVMLPPGDNLMLHKAIGLAHPGDILVVNTWGSTEHSVCGGIMVRRMKAAGIQGIIVDGCIRDTDDLKKLDFPVYARGNNPAGCRKEGPGEINFPISCGGIPVLPGYIVTADKDGIIALPPEDLPSVLEKASQKLVRENKALEEIQKGCYVKSDIDALLEAKGFAG